MSTIKFFATREAARIVAREEGETFKDMGKDAPKGERWAVEFKELSDVIAACKAVEMNVPTAEDKKLIDGLTEALNMPKSWPVKETATVAELDNADELNSVLAELDEDAVIIPAQSTTDALREAFAALDIKQAELPRPASIVRNVHEEYKDRKGAVIPVLVKRRVAI